MKGPDLVSCGEMFERDEAAFERDMSAEHKLNMQQRMKLRTALTKLHK